MLKVSFYNIAEIQIFEKLAAKRAKTEKKKIDKVDNLKAQALLDSIEYDF